MLICSTVGITMISTPKTALAAEIQYGSGGGTNSDIHLISSAEDLYNLSHNSADWGKSFKLTKDIDLPPYAGRAIPGRLSEPTVRSLLVRLTATASFHCRMSAVRATAWLHGK